MAGGPNSEMNPSPDPASPRRRLLLATALGSLLPACRKQETAAPPPDPPAPPPASSPPWLLTPGAPPPDWSQLDAWQGAVTRDQFQRQIEGVLSDGASWFRHIEITPEAALIRRSTPRPDDAPYRLRFAAPGTPVTAGPRYWRTPGELPPLSDPAKPLENLHIVLDPGHIGGSWAQMEERWYQSGDRTVREGDLTLRTARILAPVLEAMGARVSFVRTGPEPATSIQPDDLVESARASLIQDEKPATPAAIRKEAERLFYRTAEIRARGTKVNGSLRPDLVLCLHFNGIGSPDPANVQFKTANHLHILAHGCLDSGDIRHDDQRLDALLRLVQGIPDTEIPLCTAVARTMAAATGLPPFYYPGRNARMVDGQPYVWMRNLLANRIYLCPVVFLEPYVADSREVFDRIQAGDYEGTSLVAGKQRPSIFREYAGGVADGLREYFTVQRRS